MVCVYRGSVLIKNMEGGIEVARGRLDLNLE